ncbi:similar to Saccharomyces cerevisiae YOL141W PPM2 AdoMet-dependent tRNA methyltransferase also involved in methoxycarbonylation [Maudiozyma saulgeensis]|uniref:tRNA wybutosine-synthesizing protein 4 n=1 Tax=Maudiozyma saulgeensis TaxID=1789683 RepID=A0A1X7RB47_9SACH|nr:similar to Saccharomyces cerevisiae YOL141W PPM2 AdoMet-dependent tRNA methyltransferase also involved in methoxycarbonylation [Kazachstania saulgeensis]
MDPLENPTLSSLKGQQSKKERKLKYADLAVQGTNNSSIASKRSVEAIYLSKLGINKSIDNDNESCEYFKYFVPKLVNRSPCINRGYWLRLHAIRSKLESIRNATDKQILVINLGCGFDPLAFELLDKQNKDSLPFIERFSFLDIDYSDLLKNKIQIIKQTSTLSKIVGLSTDLISETDTVNCDRYYTRPCDLNCTTDYEKLMLNSVDLPQLGDPNIVKVFIAEVSLAYMKADLSDEIIRVSSLLPNAHFVMLEQLVEQGPFEPFSRQMLKHFKKNDSPLQSVTTYNTIDSQRTRFEKYGFRNINIGDMLHLWNSIPKETRKTIEAIQPFDELEEFYLFCHHYMLCHATNDPNFIFTSEYKFEITPIEAIDEDKELSVTFEPLGLDIKRSFGAGYINMEGNMVYHGGCNPNRVNETLLLTEGIMKCIVLDKPIPIPPVRTCHTFTATGSNSAVIIGGRNAPHRPYKDVWLYDSKQNKWTQRQTLPETRFRHCTVSIGQGKLLIFGGVTTGEPFMIYDSNNDTYESVSISEDSDFSQLNLVSACMSYNEDINLGCLVGGLNTDSNVVSDTLYSFTLETNKITLWKIISHPLLSRYGAKCSYINSNKIVVVGGTSQNILFGSETTIVAVDLKMRKVNSLVIPPAIWEEHGKLCFVGFELQRLNDKQLIVLGGAATCYGFGAISNDSMLINFQPIP